MGIYNDLAKLNIYPGPGDVVKPLTPAVAVVSRRCYELASLLRTLIVDWIRILVGSFIIGYNNDIFDWQKNAHFWPLIGCNSRVT